MGDVESIARAFTEAWNKRDWDTLRGMMHVDYSYTGGDGQRMDGPDAGMGVAQMFANAFPDGRIDIQHVHAAGNVAVVEFIGRGTHKGDLMGVAPTGRSMAMPVCNVVVVKDGKVLAEREYMDMAYMMQQLGVTEAPAAATA